MGYGFQAFGSNGQTLFDTDDANNGGYFLDITAGPSAWAVNTSVSYSAGDIVLATCSPSSGSLEYIYYDDSGSSITFTRGSGTYIKVRPGNASASTPSGYGLVIYDGTGTANSDIIFSTSDTNSQALDIQTILNVGALSGNTNSATSSRVYTGISGVYVSLKGGQDPTSGGGSRAFLRNQYFFTNSYTFNNGFTTINYGTGIHFVSRWNDTSGIGIGDIYFPNENSIMVATIRS